MGLIKFNYRSQVLSGYVDISIAYPTDFMSYYDMSAGIRGHQRHVKRNYPVYKPGMKFQTVYLIHGGGDDDSLTYRYLNSEFYAQKNYCMTVTPNICNSFGINTAYGIDYEKFLTEELPVVVQSLFASSPKREDNFIVGYAMGGNVALGQALKHPELYAACVDISGGIGYTLDIEKLKADITPDTRFKLYYHAFGGDNEKLAGSQYDARVYAKRNIEEGRELPKFTFIIGSEEGEIGEAVKNDARLLKEYGYDSDLIVHQGYEHYFPLWDLAVKEALDEILPLKRKPLYEE